MPKKTITIFITTFIITGIIILGVYWWLNREKATPPSTETPWYQNFNPFGIGTNKENPDTEPGVENPDAGLGATATQTSRFYQITDFAIAGATFLIDTRPIVKTAEEKVQPEEIKIIIKADTKEGRKEIQTILNKTLSLNPPLVADGNFGKKTIQAIKDFQKLNSITVTGIIDELTAPYFIKTTTSDNNPPENMFEQSPSIRFVERMNGHIYKMFLDTKIKDKVSNSTIPNIYEASFSENANTVIYRYLSSEKTINSFIATLGAVKGEFLPQDISDLSISQDKTKFFYLVENSNGSVGNIGTFGSTEKTLIFSSPFTEWLSQWDNNGRIFLTTKPSYNVLGSMFLLNAANKTITKVFGGIDGLTTLVNKNGALVLYSTSTKTGPKLGIFDTNKHSTKDLDTYGLPEKCVWSNDNISVYCAVPNTIVGSQYPDLWYQGLVSFDDYFVKINILTGDKITIANSVDGTPVDGTYLLLNNTEDLLFFTNKKDSTLWSLDIR
jgi:peptidoglycan hydrolase-like protein with peptidoglycan-binding domain